MNLRATLASITAPLRTPTQRLWFLFALVGLLILVGATTLFAVENWRQYWYTSSVFSLLGELLQRVFEEWPIGQGGWQRDSVHAFRVGLVMLITGAVFSYLYNYTLGAVVRWVRNG
jgi:hypothetical protein